MAIGRTKSLSEIVDDSGSMYNPWPKQYGEIRGGSQAMKIDDDNYLLFFHSSRDPPGTITTTSSTIDIINNVSTAIIITTIITITIINIITRNR